MIDKAIIVVLWLSGGRLSLDPQFNKDVNPVEYTLPTITCAKSTFSEGDPKYMCVVNLVKLCPVVWTQRKLYTGYYFMGISNENSKSILCSIAVSDNHEMLLSNNEIIIIVSLPYETFLKES